MNRLVTAERVRGGPPDSNSILIADGRVSEIGEVANLRRPGIAETAYPHATIVPGLVDSHFHPVGYTASVFRLNVDGSTDHADLVERIRTYSSDLDPAEPIIGTRLNEEAMAEQSLPDRHLLDAALSDRPLLVYRYDGHVAVANTTALAAGGVTGDTKPPSGGAIEVDAAGNPTGVLKETAIDLVAEALGGRASNLRAPELLSVLGDLRSMGLTRLGAMASLGRGLFCGGGRELELLCEVSADLPLRLDVFVIADNPADLEHGANLISDARSSRLRFAGVKIFADGSFGGRTAAMDTPFDDRATRGIDRLEPTRDLPLARAALDMGAAVAVHAIGDRANATVLDFHTTLLDEGADPGRLRIEHASVLRSDDFERMADLGVTASVQPAFLSSEFGWVESILGPERLRRTYAFRSMLDAGIPLAGGSDCPVEPPGPLAGMAAARHRHGLNREQRLSGEESLDLFSSSAARALGVSGGLQPHGAADFTVLADDPVTVAPEALPTIAVEATWIDGQPT